jgi:hypothetical protein
VETVDYFASGGLEPMQFNVVLRTPVMVMMPIKRQVMLILRYFDMKVQVVPEVAVGLKWGDNSTLWSHPVQIYYRAPLGLVGLMFKVTDFQLIYLFGAFE